jgi:hypothetical protein
LAQAADDEPGEARGLVTRSVGRKRYDTSKLGEAQPKVPWHVSMRVGLAQFSHFACTYLTGPVREVGGFVLRSVMKDILCSEAARSKRMAEAAARQDRGREMSGSR